MYFWNSNKAIELAKENSLNQKEQVKILIAGFLGMFLVVAPYLMIWVAIAIICDDYPIGPILFYLIGLAVLSIAILVIFLFFTWKRIKQLPADRVITTILILHTPTVIRSLFLVLLAGGLAFGVQSQVYPRTFGRMEGNLPMGLIAIFCFLLLYGNDLLAHLKKVTADQGNLKKSWRTKTTTLLVLLLFPILGVTIWEAQTHTIQNRYKAYKKSQREKIKLEEEKRWELEMQIKYILEWADEGNFIPLMGFYKMWDIDIINRNSPSGNSFLGLAIRFKDKKAIDFILDKNPDLDHRNKNGDTALHLAMEIENYQLAKRLIKLGASTKIKNNKGATALNGKDLDALLEAQKAEKNKADSQQNKIMETVNEGTVAELQSLLAAGADVNTTDENGLTPLMLAVYLGKKEIVDFLLKNDASINAINTNGQTALHIATLKGDAEMIETLLKNGADTEIRDNDGNTAMDLVTGE